MFPDFDVQFVPFLHKFIQRRLEQRYLGVQDAYPGVSSGDEIPQKRDLRFEWWIVRLQNVTRYETGVEGWQLQAGGSEDSDGAGA
jgi:hypothetical protein